MGDGCWCIDRSRPTCNEQCRVFRDYGELRAQVERLREAGRELDDVIRRLSREVDELREALTEAIGWSYGDGPTPERRDELERLVTPERADDHA